MIAASLKGHKKVVNLLVKAEVELNLQDEVML